VFRACLHLHGAEPAASTHDVITQFCAHSDVDPEPFYAIEDLRSGNRRQSLDELLTGYHEQLCRAVEAVDRFAPT
jgi:hypothetical protein